MSLRIAGLMAKVRRVAKSDEFVAEFACECRHPGAGPDEIFRPSRRHDPAPDDDGRPIAEFEKDRQMAHGYRPRDFIVRNDPSRAAGPAKERIEFTRRLF